ncbi:type IIG restriction enzyme/methyltransferase [Burkholderia cepacia]|uniref:type IIG restriction enzyme/methyltransferase n=1 Tax=Burkholderia cepacia TaxID=292 RepID=UPI001588EA5C|nr:DNA methyltransferase [Burkholderia cepacia]MCA8057467.1 Eco57I restriction-modification methylase domain-containing protein [Burkholderia cepacia]MCA8133554.1 Eco57I restriction-modification methylase domain-containing protein [Burkholderia cepacia]MCA8161839.1 Eco57I restriction-modification methylase domain-containing protein [Burkholderia cepacia]
MTNSIRVNPKQALNKAFLRTRPQRSEIEKFKENLLSLIDHANDTESEEFHKNLVRDFLNKTYYQPTNFVNTKGFNDLVVHLGPSADDPVGIILEAKKPTNLAAMPSASHLDSRAFQELVLYYMRERFSANNIQVKHLICTNLYQWFIFDVKDFERNFAQDKSFVKAFLDFESGRLADNKTAFFYKTVASPAIKAVEKQISYTYFDIKDYESVLRSKAADGLLIPLFKLLSPQHLLKLPFANDSNSLDKGFYAELLHIIGLEEISEGGKKLIVRKPNGNRDAGSLIENAILRVDSLDKLDNVKGVTGYGKNRDERLFNVALELSITWVNRILFLKLLEAQLLAFHTGDASYAFLKQDKVHTFSALEDLFFQVLAKRAGDRTTEAQATFSKVPYLNSSLFELIELEKQTISIGSLSDDKSIDIYKATVLKDDKGQRLTGSIKPVDYLLNFLSAFDFAADSKEQIQEDSKRLINASVLGLIFEKINGYKDGSFFTPGYVTMQMCHETIIRAAIQKFNEAKGWDCTNIDELYDKIEDRAEANKILNSLRICDPAVGSGHFLVSALNEMIALKARLNILIDRGGKRLKEYKVEVQADELVVSDEDGELVEYKPTSKESQRVQEALFHEKQIIIENCLFGVDINPNSVKICRLRLWIELLKHAYYDKSGQLETLPNIDINIKQGDSTISRFALDEDLKQALKKSGRSLADYRNAVSTYRDASTKEKKREMEHLINEIKDSFRVEILSNGRAVVRKRNAQDEYNSLKAQRSLFEASAKEKAARKKRLEKLKATVDSLQAKLDAIQSGRIYEGAFEWRFEFPEVLDDVGTFEGFDVVIANPPYIDSEKMVKDGHADVREYLAETWACAKGNWDLYIVFIELGLSLMKKTGTMAYITPDKWISKPFGDALRIQHFDKMQSVTVFGRDVFESALVDSIVTIFTKNGNNTISTALLEGGVNTPLLSVEKSELQEPYNLDLLFSPHYAFICNLVSCHARLDSLIHAENACATSDAYKLKPLVGNADGNFSAKKYYRLVNTGTLGKYVSKWGVRPITYLGLKPLEPVVSRSEFAAEFLNSYKDKADAKKIIVKGLTLLDAALDLDGDTIPGKTTLILRSDDDALLKYVAAVLNCPISIFYIKARYSSSSYNGGITFTKEMLNSLPIPTDTKVRAKVVVQVDKLLAKKQADVNANVDALVNTINEILYRSFELTDDQIKMIEGSTTEQTVETVD